MWLFFAAAAILAIPFLANVHYRNAIVRVKFADEVWGSLEQHARVLLEDRTLSPRLGDLIEKAISHAGDGQLTRDLLYSIVVRKKAQTVDDLSNEIDRLTDGQRYQFTRFLVDAVLYDSLRTIISGSILRRIVMYWLESTARDDQVSISRTQISPMINAAGKAYHLA